jgi:hypothetical protein
VIAQDTGCGEWGGAEVDEYFPPKSTSTRCLVFEMDVKTMMFSTIISSIRDHSLLAFF